MRSSGRRRLCVLLCAALVAGCSGGSPGAAPSPPPGTTANPAGTTANPAGTASSPTAAAAAHQPAQRCRTPDTAARLVAPRTDDGVVPAAAEVGAGRRGVVLVPESGPSGLCGWWEYAAYLAGQGFHVLLFDQRCSGESHCPPGGEAPGSLAQDVAAVSSTLHADGARRIVLVGASRGAAEVVLAGARAASGDPALAPVAGVAALSPDRLDEPMAGAPFPTARRAAPGLRLPTLIAVAPGDHYAPVPDVQRLYKAIPAADKHLVVVSDQPGLHGWTMLTPDPATGRMPPLSATLVAFLQKYTG